MFDKSEIPAENAQFKQFLNNLYNQSGANSEQKGTIDRKLTKIQEVISEKIVKAPTISEYFNKLWTQEEIREKDKELVIKKLEAIQQGKKIQIINAVQPVAKTSANLDNVINSFKMTSFEEFNMQQKVEEVKKKKKFNLDNFLLSHSVADPDVLRSLNKPYRSAQNILAPNVLHYTSGILGLDEPDTIKIQKAEEFVKKVQEDKKAFAKKMRQIEKSVEEREKEQLDRLKKKLQEEEEIRHREKKEKVQQHIRSLKAGAQERAKNMDNWKEEYKQYLNKKPLYKEIEDNFKKGFLLPELEERKRRLQEIRDFHRPIVREELLEHEQRIKKVLEEQEAKKRSADSKWNYQKPSYESNHHRVFAEEAVRIRKRKEEEKMDQLKKKERIQELMQDIKEKHFPTIDPQKELELVQQIQQLNKKQNNQRTSNSEERLEEYNRQKQLGNDYLKAAREAIKKAETSKVNTTEDQTSDKRDKKLTSNSIKSEDTALRKRNYLVDLRKDNIIHSNVNLVDLIIRNKDLDYSDKKELLKSEVEKLEEKAQRMEFMRKYQSKKKLPDDVNEADKVDQMYINAIKAKIEMLSH